MCQCNHITPPIFAMENCDTIAVKIQNLNRKKFTVLASFMPA